MRELEHLLVELSGTNLIEASAGTGKTYAIATLYLRLILEKELTPEQILVVTYTEAATKELRGRIRKRLREAIAVLDGSDTNDIFLSSLLSQTLQEIKTVHIRQRLEDAIALFDTASIFTIHGFCLRALQDNAFESGASFETELVTDVNPLIQEIVDDFWRNSFFGDSAELLQGTLQRKYSPKNLANFAKQLCTNGNVIIKPSFSNDEITTIQLQCQRIYVELCTKWNFCKNEIEDIFQNYKGLSHSVDNYHPKLIHPLFEKMELYCKLGNPYKLFDDFSKFTISGVTTGTKKTASPPAHLFFDFCQHLQDLVNTRFLILRSEFASYCRQGLINKKAEKSIRFFDDLIIDLQTSLSRENGSQLAKNLQSKYKAALIDEFQDTDSQQYDIFRRIYAGTDVPLFLIGDPKQAIYSFRGADIFAYLSAAADVAQEKQYTLTGNWRSTPSLLNAFNSLFLKPKPFLFDNIKYHPVSSGKEEQLKTDILASTEEKTPMQIWLVPSGDDGKPLGVADANSKIATAVAGEIFSLLTRKMVVPSDIAVIVRSHKQATYIHKALQKIQIPCVVRSDKSVFESHEAHELYTLLFALTDPINETKIRTALVTDILGYTAYDIAMLIFEDGKDGLSGKWQELLGQFCDYHQLWREKGFMAAMRHLMAQANVRARLLSYPDGERRLTDLLHCCELIHNICSKNNFGMETLLSWFGERISSQQFGDETQIRLETDEQAVKIVTVHVSKGLEYPIVFCPYLWGGIPDYDDVICYHDGFNLIKDFGSLNYQKERNNAHKERLAESLRLLYVALTRAKERCYLVSGKIVDKGYTKKTQTRPQTSPLAYLFHSNDQPLTADDLVETLGSAVVALSDIDMEQQLKSRFTPETNSIAIVPMPDIVVKPFLSKDVASEDALQCRVFKRSLSSDWRVTSFSGLAAHDSGAIEVVDRDEPVLQPITQEKPKEISIYTFPRGAQAGVCLHEIFEKLDFATAEAKHLTELVEKTLHKYGYDQKWHTVIVNMVKNIITTPLSSTYGVFTLSDLDKGTWIAEMEFFFPLSYITCEKLGAILQRYLPSAIFPTENSMARILHFKPVCGMLRGFIDMVFEHCGRYYLVDWKSNHLGYMQDDYKMDKLSSVMEQNLYYLQYLLYCVALNRYLSLRILNYNYENDFGGVMYVFLRGVNPTFGEEYGFYRDVPPKPLIDELTECLVECGDIWL